MTDLGAGQIVPLFTNDSPDRFGLFGLKNFTTGDTVDMATWFSVVKFAIVFAPTKPGAGICTVAGSVVTLAPASMSGEGGYLMVYGAAK